MDRKKQSMEQKIQEQKYEFPYHHIPSNDEHFSQARNLFWGYEYMSYIEFVINEIKEKDFESLLDIGCGDGKFLYEIKEIIPEKKLTGTDFSSKSIAFAKAFSPEIEFLATKQPEKELEVKFDIITSIEVLEHIPAKEIDYFVNQIHSLLNEKGVLILTTPSENKPLIDKHFQHFTEEKLENIFGDKFSIKELYYLNKTSWKSSILRRLFSNRFFILNYKPLLDYLYRQYKSKMLLTNSDSGKRIMMVAVKK